MGWVFTSRFATHANILSSVRSTQPHDWTSLPNRMLLYRFRVSLLRDAN
jgi:hypothetical protein